MSFEAWTTFAIFWAVFVTTPGPNAVNCNANGMQLGFVRSLWAVTTSKHIFTAHKGDYYDIADNVPQSQN